MTGKSDTVAGSSGIERGKALTANRLHDGCVVFFTRAGTWSEAIDDAAIGLEPQSAAAMERRGFEAVSANFVTDPYLFDVERQRGRVRAVHIRERIRALGPTVRADLGKQADGCGSAFAATS